MKKSCRIHPVIFIPTILLAILVTWMISRPNAYDVANMPHERHGPFALGDMNDAVLEKVNTFDALILIGVYEQTDQGPQWTYHHVQGGPIVKLLNDSEMYQNRFLNLGWTYPRHPPTQKVIVVQDGHGWNLNYVYIYINDTNKVAAIYVGNT